MTTPKTAVLPLPVSSPCRSLPLFCSRGYTLIEVVAVMAILAVLVMLSVPAYSKIQLKAKQVACMRELRDLEKVVMAQGIDKGGVFPTTWALAGIPAPIDPWGNAYVISAPFRKDITFINSDFDIYSKGDDGISAQDIEDAESLDDVLRAGDGGFVGLVSNILF